MTNNQFQLLFYAVRAAHPSCWDITARLPLAIAKQETGNFTAHAFSAYNNLFGMTAPNARNTTATNKGSGKVATFNSLFDGMSDFFLWCEAFELKNDQAVQKFVDDLRYNKNPAYPGLVGKIATQLTASGALLPALLFQPVVAGGAAVLSVAAVYAAFSS